MSTDNRACSHNIKMTFTKVHYLELYIAMQHIDTISIMDGHMIQLNIWHISSSYVYKSYLGIQRTEQQ